MRKDRIFRIFSLTGLVVALVGGTSAPAEEYRGTMQQQMACTPDVFRFCGAEIPDATRIVACLRLNTLHLSESCRAVFESRDSATSPPPRTSAQPAAPPVRRSYQYQ